MINIIIKENGNIGWVKLPLSGYVLNSIKPEDFLTEKEMILFTLQEIELYNKRVLRYLTKCTENDLYLDKLNPNIKDLINWITDSFGLLLPKNTNTEATVVCRNMWYKLHNLKCRNSPLPVTSSSFTLG